MIAVAIGWVDKVADKDDKSEDENDTVEENEVDPDTEAVNVTVQERLPRTP